MQYSMLGNTGLAVSRLCFGAMTFRDESTTNAHLAKVRGADADALVGRAVEAGINFFDTADVYSSGDSEVMLGAALKARRNEVIIATKCGLRSGQPLTQSGLSRRHILWSIDQSLKRMDTDWIDVYIVHRQDPLTPLEETLQALDDIVRAGKVRYIGFSNWSAWKVSAALEMQKSNGWARFTHGQMSYSLLTRDIEYDIVPMMQEYGIGLTVWSPLASGLLSGKYTRDNLHDPANRLGATQRLPLDVERGLAVTDILRTIAQRHDKTVAQIALAWVLANPTVTGAILGTTKISQLDDNLGAVDVNLTVEDMQVLNEATALGRLYPNWFHDFVADRTLLAALGKTATK